MPASKMGLISAAGDMSLDNNAATATRWLRAAALTHKRQQQAAAGSGNLCLLTCPLLCTCAGGQKLRTCEVRSGSARASSPTAVLMNIYLAVHDLAPVRAQAAARESKTDMAAHQGMASEGKRPRAASAYELWREALRAEVWGAPTQSFSSGA